MLVETPPGLWPLLSLWLPRVPVDGNRAQRIFQTRWVGRYLFPQHCAQVSLHQAPKVWALKYENWSFFSSRVFVVDRVPKRQVPGWVGIRSLYWGATQYWMLPNSFSKGSHHVILYFHQQHIRMSVSYNLANGVCCQTRAFLSTWQVRDGCRPPNSSGRI